IHLTGGKYTWSNQQAHPTLEKLDRVLMSYAWEDLFPLVSVRKLVRDKSDHNPLLLSLKADRPGPPKKKEFRFELSWLSNDLFLPRAKEIWE
uniref:Endonuclease/exonuclease/phosphatase domain-containing protein n=1 Tax=Aegilops tauschii subsp. strangulata TaxID=200361 RepID=A0A452YE98_AEGTS